MSEIDYTSVDEIFIVYVGVSIHLANIDGKLSKQEGQLMGDFLKAQPGMDEDRYKNIVQKGVDEYENSIEKALLLATDDQVELLNLMIEVATSDGYFHGKEVNFIAALSAYLGFNGDRILESIRKDYDFDENEFKEAYNEYMKRVNQKREWKFD